MANPTQTNQGGAQQQERQPKQQTASQPSGQPVGGQWARQQKDGMKRQDQAERNNRQQAQAALTRELHE